MIKIIDDLHLEGYQLVEEGWNFPIIEIDYLLKEHSGETFWLRSEDCRLYEIEEVENND